MSTLCIPQVKTRLPSLISRYTYTTHPHYIFKSSWRTALGNTVLQLLVTPALQPHPQISTVFGVATPFSHIVTTKLASAHRNRLGNTLSFATYTSTSIYPRAHSTLHLVSKQQHIPPHHSRSHSHTCPW